MSGFGVGQASTQYNPGYQIVPGVEVPFPQNEAVRSFLASINHDLFSQYNPPSVPSYVPGDGHYQPPYPAPSTSTGFWASHSANGASALVSVFTCRGAIMLC